MLFIEITKIKLTGGHIEFMLVVEMVKIESTGGHIKIMLFIEITKIKLTGGHIEFMLIIEMAKIEIKRRLCWIYANSRDGQNRNYLAAILDLWPK